MDTAVQHLQRPRSYSKGEKVKTAILLHALGEEALEVYNSLSIEPQGENEIMQDIITALVKNCLPQKKSSSRGISSGPTPCLNQLVLISI